MKLFTRFTALTALLLLVGTSAFAQTTASLTGTVTTGGTALPGVTVTISSVQMQGTRTTVTGDAGGYAFGAIPAGDYTVKFELSGMSTETKRAKIGVGQNGRADADLKVSSVAEAITVTAAAPSVLETPQVSQNLSAKMIADLPVNRGVTATASLAPGVNTNTFSAGQLSISGSPGYDNLVMVNGVAITESVRSQELSLYVEDAIQETTVLTGAISAEYGRFTGGVVNSITKSGGNEFSGSIRDNMSNNAWSAENPLQIAGKQKNVDVLNSVYEGTLGGFVLRDRLWFFGDGRKSKTTSTVSTRIIPGDPTKTSLTAVSPAQENRWEGKLTGQLTAKHNVVVSFLDREANAQNTQFTTVSYDLESLAPRRDPIHLFSGHYNGVLTNNWMVEAQLSRMKWGVANGNGSQFQDFVRGTIVRNLNDGRARFNSPTFCGVCDKETRANKGGTLKTNYFLSTKGMGNMNIVGGVEHFGQQRFANNFQSGSNFRFFVNGVTRIGDVLYPTVNPGTAVVPGSSSSTAYIVNTPIFVNARESDLATNSAFVNDRWDLNSHWSFSGGLRYDKNDATDSSGNKVSKDSRLSPRLNATYDITGDGRHRVTASYGDYVSQIVEGPGTAQAAAGQPSYIYYVYNGPAINPTGTPASQLVDTRAALAIVQNWFEHQCNAAGQCGAANHSLIASGTAQSVPGFTSIIGNLKSPYVREYTLGYGAQMFSNAVFRADFVSRDWSDFYGFRIDNTTPQRPDPFLGINHDVSIVENTNDIKRQYRGLQLQTNWRPNRFNVGLNYTYATLKGNDEQENATSGTVGNAPGSINYPQLKNFAQNQPIGYLAGDERNRARAWVAYDVPMPRYFGALNLSLLQNYDSGLPYSAVANINVGPYKSSLIAGTTYVEAPSSVQYYFSKRGQYRTPNISSTSLGVNYRYPIGRFELYASGDLINLFNAHNAIIVSTTVNTFTGGTQNPFNPFTTAPKECPQGQTTAQCVAGGFNWQKSTTFGQPTSAAASVPTSGTTNFQVARTYRFSFGARF
jgi:outer membrane receptor protein involved in Fe transport